ncbi:MAG: hypothetical protein NZL87_09840, partial [Thermomicrobium sp.]|nr:hypothetical protein [Thermomicrobium sp.]
MPTRSLTVQFSHVEVVKILLPALELLLVRTHDLVNGTRDEPPYARWIRETGYSLIASLRRELHDVPWGQRLLTLTVDSDGLGLLAAASGALRRHVREHGDAALGTLLDEARQRIWMTAPLDMELTWWVARSALTEELLPLLRSIRSRSPDPNEAQHAERLLQVTFARLRAQNGDAVRLQTPLADLARLAQWTSRTTEPLRLGGLLQQLVDPLVLERHVTAKRRHESQHNDRTWSESRGADGRGSGQNTSSSANAGQRQERAATETRAQADT